MTHQFLTTKDAITDWLDKDEVKNYSLVPDEKYGFKVNAQESVYLNNKNLIFIPVKFNIIYGDFWCQNNKLTSLEFSPHTIKGSFQVYNNKLTSLEFCPRCIEGVLGIFQNDLNDLRFCPEKAASVNCHGNPRIKEIEKIQSFKEFYRLHKECLIEHNYNQLESKLKPKSSSSHKIKI